MTLPSLAACAAAISHPAPLPDRSVRARLVWMTRLLGVLLASHFTLAYLHGTYHFLDIGRYAAGQAALPFQYRALPAWVMRFVLHLPGQPFLPPDGPASMLQPDILAWAALVFLSTLWILHEARVAALLVWRNDLAARLAALSFMPVLYITYEAIANNFRPSYVYDLPSLALFFATFTAVLRGRRPAMLVLFTLATLSRETSVYLIAVFLCWHWFDAAGGRRATAGYAGTMAAIWLAVRWLVVTLYADNATNPELTYLSGPGHGLSVQFFNNLRMMANPLHLANILSALCWLWLPVALFWRSIGDRRLLLSILVCTPPVVAAMLLVGRVAEPRVFAELSVLYWLAAVGIAQNLARGEG